MAKNGKTNGHDTTSDPTTKLIHTEPHQRGVKRRAGHIRAQRALARTTEQQSATEQFNAIVQRVTSDLGGPDQITEIEKHLIMSFVGAALLQRHQLMLILNGTPIDIHEYSSVCTAMIRTTMRLGSKRRAKEVNPLDQYLKGRGRKRVHVDADVDVEADA